MDGEIRSGLESDTRMTHERFLEAMNQRLPDLSDESLEKYFAVLSTFVGKLEDRAKPLSDVIQETMTDAAGFIMGEIAGGA